MYKEVKDVFRKRNAHVKLLKEEHLKFRQQRQKVNSCLKVTINDDKKKFSA